MSNNNLGIFYNKGKYAIHNFCFIQIAIRIALLQNKVGFLK